MGGRAVKRMRKKIVKYQREIADAANKSLLRTVCKFGLKDRLAVCWKILRRRYQ